MTLDPMLVQMAKDAVAKYATDCPAQPDYFDDPEIIDDLPEGSVVALHRGEWTILPADARVLLEIVDKIIDGEEIMGVEDLITKAEALLEAYWDRLQDERERLTTWAQEACPEIDLHQAIRQNPKMMHAAIGKAHDTAAQMLRRAAHTI